MQCLLVLQPTAAYVIYTYKTDQPLTHYTAAIIAIYLHVELATTQTLLSITHRTTTLVLNYLGKNTSSLSIEACCTSGTPVPLFPLFSLISLSMAVSALTISSCPVPDLELQRHNRNFSKNPSILGSMQIRCSAFATSVMNLFSRN